MTRRSLFATLLAPLVAKFARKPKFESGCAIAHAYKEAGHTFYVTEFWPLENPYIYFMGPLQDFDFLAGHYRTASVDQAPAVLEATRKPVKATVDAKTHKLKDIEVTTLPWKTDFFATKTIDQLVAEQGVQPIQDLSTFGFLSDEEVHDLIAAIHQSRQG